MISLSFLVTCLMIIVLPYAKCENITALSAATDVNFNDHEELGGDDEVGKISRIQVYAGNFLFNRVVSKICTTYVLRDGNPKTRTLCHGKGNDFAGTFDVPENVYIEKVRKEMTLQYDHT